MRSRPNILVIHADQHRFDCLGAYGNPDVLTPHINSLAADGVVYNESFCTYPVCTPSRYSLLTGVPVHSATRVADLSGDSEERGLSDESGR